MILPSRPLEPPWRGHNNNQSTRVIRHQPGYGGTTRAPQAAARTARRRKTAGRASTTRSDEGGETEMILVRRLLGDVLRSRRQRTGRTLRQLAATARVSPGYLSEVERGQKEPSSELL